jgi:choline-sulfatase
MRPSDISSIGRRQFLQRLGVLAAAAAAPRISFSQNSSSASAKQEQYNVLWLMTDQHSPHVLGCYGDKLIQTPTLDSLAKNGVRFTNGYCQDPICVPSRTSFLTSKMPSQLMNQGIHGMENDYDGPTLANVFNKAGYKTAWLGKSHYAIKDDFQTTNKPKKGSRNSALDLSRKIEAASICDWSEEDDFETIVTNDSIKFIEENKNKPFFLGVSFVKPHFPYTIFERFYKLYAEKMDVPKVTPEEIRNLPPIEKTEYGKYGFSNLTEEQIRHCRAIYYGMVTYCDELFGRVLKKLDQLDLRRKTIILYTSDHGDMIGEKGMWYKNSFYDSSVRVPMIWSFPGVLPVGTIMESAVGNIDYLPTLCELCRVPVPSGITGKSIVPHLIGKDTSTERITTSENYRDGFAAKMVTTGKYKFIHYDDGGPEIFYDRFNDPTESVNLLKDAKYKELAANFREIALKDWKPEKGVSLDNEDGEKTGKKKKKDSKGNA